MNWLTDRSISYIEWRRWFKLEQARAVVWSYNRNVLIYKNEMQIAWLKLALLKRERDAHVISLENNGTPPKTIEKFADEYARDMAKVRRDGTEARVGLGLLTIDYTNARGLLRHNTAGRRYWAGRLRMIVLQHLAGASPVGEM